jgi:hypothetical protein
VEDTRAGDSDVEAIHDEVELPKLRCRAEMRCGTTAATYRCMSIAIHSTSIGPGVAAPANAAGARDVPPLRPADSWLDALVKLIPGEVIIAFTAALQVSGVGDSRSAHLAILMVFAALCPIVLWASSRRAGIAAHWLQYAVRSIAFVLYGFGSDHVLLSWLNTLAWIPGVGALVIAVLAALVLSPPGTQQPPVDP